MSQNFRLSHVSNLSVRNFRIFLLMYPARLSRSGYISMQPTGRSRPPAAISDIPTESEPSSSLCQPTADGIQAGLQPTAVLGKGGRSVTVLRCWTVAISHIARQTMRWWCYIARYRKSLLCRAGQDSSSQRTGLRFSAFLAAPMSFLPNEYDKYIPSGLGTSYRGGRHKPLHQRLACAAWLWSCGCGMRSQAAANRCVSETPI